MVGVASGLDSKKITIFGHGIVVPERFEISEGIALCPYVPRLDLETTVAGCPTFADYAAALQGNEIASFTIEVEHVSGGKELAIKAWNSLWLFHLLSVACKAPCLMLYSMSDGQNPLYSAASPTPFIKPVEKNCVATLDRLTWAKENQSKFNNLIKNSEFGSAMRCFGGAHYLMTNDVRIMLLWAGIEGLLSVDAELSRRLALYAALIIEGTSEQKIAYFEKVKKAYVVRSRVVHGGTANPAKLKQGYEMASSILADLLVRCVELGKVPSPKELDLLAVEATVT